MDTTDEFISLTQFAYDRATTTNKIVRACQRQKIPLYTCLGSLHIRRQDAFKLVSAEVREVGADEIASVVRK